MRLKTLSVSQSASDRLGFKLTDHSISVVENQIRVKANDGSPFRVDASAAGIAGSVVEMSNLAHEDLLVDLYWRWSKIFGRHI